jgi:GNAT superfamily N-acetyltransferase
MSDPYEISTDPTRLDVALIHRWLSQSSYWAKGIPRDIVERAVANSLNFGVFHAEEGQVGYARVVSDRATFAYLADVFVLEPHRGKGLSKRLMAAVLAHPDLQNLRRWTLATRDAHGLYEQFGFTVPKVANRVMERVDPDIYARLGRPQEA